MCNFFVIKRMGLARLKRDWVAAMSLAGIALFADD
jgi:hypothetical protein